MTAFKFDWKYIAITAGLLAVTGFTYMEWAQIVIVIKRILEVEHLNLIVGAFAAILALMVKIKQRKLKFHNSMSFNEFRVPFEDLTSFIGNPITLACSVSLIKGLFLDFTGGASSGAADLYFPKLQSIEVVFLWLLTAYLLYLSIMEVVSNVKVLIFKLPSNIEEPTPIPPSQTGDETIPPPANPNGT